MIRRTSYAAVIVLSALAVSCAPSMAAIDRTMSEGIVWPGGQEKPRIKYLWSMQQVKGAEKGSAGRILFGAPVHGEDQRDSDVLVAPHGIYYDGSGRLFITDPGAGRVCVVNMSDMKSFFITETGDVPVFSPVAVVTAPDGRIYISDSGLGRVGMFDPDGDFMAFVDGDMQRPTGLAVDALRGVLYVADTWRHIIYTYDLDGHRTGSIGGHGTGKGQFNYPTHLAVGADGTLYVSDTLNFRVQLLTPEGEYLGGFGVAGETFDAFDKIKGIAVDSEGHIYITDSLQDMVKIYDKDGRLLLFFGKRGGFYGDFKHPAGVYIDSDDHIYVADTFNSRVQAFQFLGGD